MSDMQFSCFSFVLLTSRQPVFQNCKEILSALFHSLADDGKQTFKLLTCYLLSDSLLSFHGQVRRVTGQISIQLASYAVSVSVIGPLRICAMFGDCQLASYMFTKTLCSLSTEIDKPALKYPARYTGLYSVFE